MDDIFLNNRLEEQNRRKYKNRERHTRNAFDI